MFCEADESGETAPVPGPPQWIAERKSPLEEMTASPVRNPAASSMS